MVDVSAKSQHMLQLCRLRALWIRAETVVAFTRSRFLTSAVATNMTRKDHVAWITVKTCYNEDTSMMMWQPEALKSGNVGISSELDIIEVHIHQKTFATT